MRYPSDIDIQTQPGIKELCAVGFMRILGIGRNRWHDARRQVKHGDVARRALLPRGVAVGGMAPKADSFTVWFKQHVHDHANYMPDADGPHGAPTAKIIPACFRKDLLTQYNNDMVTNGLHSATLKRSRGYQVRSLELPVSSETTHSY